MGTRHTQFFMDKEYPNIPMGGGSGGGATIDVIYDGGNIYNNTIQLTEDVTKYDYIYITHLLTDGYSHAGDLISVDDLTNIFTYNATNNVSYTLNTFSSYYMRLQIGEDNTKLRCFDSHSVYIRKIYGIKYGGASGGGGGGGSYSETDLFVNTTPTTMPPATITLDDDFTNYDILYFDIIRGADSRAYHIGKELLVSTLAVGDSFQFLIYSGEYFSFTITDSTTFTRLNYGGDYLYKIIGIKH